MKPQSCKGKGRRLQQQVARDILDAFPQLQPDDVRSTSMGAGGEDVQLSPAARLCMPYSVECKNTERLAIWSALEQCRSNAPPGTTPLVVFKRNRSETYAVIPWSHLVQLLRGTQPTPVPAPGPLPPEKRSEIVAVLQTAVQQVSSLLEGAGASA